MLAVSATVRWSAPSPFAPRVNVRWSARLSGQERSNLERRFTLMAGQHLADTTWAYDLTNPSSEIVSALVGHPSVEDTHQIDRGATRVTALAPHGTTRLAGDGPAGWVHSLLFTWFMLFWFTSFVVSGAWIATAGNRQSR